jgi:uncharacterized membrane protein YphA (DoxX/SURF4 family)
MFNSESNAQVSIKNNRYSFKVNEEINAHKKQNSVIEKINRKEEKIIEWMYCNGKPLLRVSIGIVYFWFGFLKFFPGSSPAEILAAKTISQLSFGYISSNFSLPLLAVWECAVGVGLITSRGMRVILVLLFLQMSGTFLPLIFFPDQTWTNLFVPTLEGQYIIKNIVIVSSGLVLGGTLGSKSLIMYKDMGNKSKRA